MCLVRFGFPIALAEDGHLQHRDILITTYPKVWYNLGSSKIHQAEFANVGILQGWCIEMFSIEISYVSHQPPCMLSCRPSPTSLHGCGRVVVFDIDSLERNDVRSVWARAGRALLTGRNFTGLSARGTGASPWSTRCDSNYIFVPFGANQVQAQEVV